MKMKVVLVNREARTYVGPWEWSDESVPSGDYLTLADATAQGFTLAPPPPPPVPSEVPAWKIVQVLKKRQHYDPLDEFIFAMKGPQAPAIQARWEFAEAFPRDGQAVDALLNAALGYTSAQTDDLFREAYALPG